MEEFFRALPNTFIPLFVAIDVFWLLPLFIGMTAEMTVEKSRVVLRQSVLTALLVSLAFVVVGEFIFSVIGITPDDFKVAGGTVLLVIAVLDLTSGQKRSWGSSETIGVVPIGVPLIVGPAVLTSLLVLTEHFGVLPTVAGLVLNLLLMWIALTVARGIVNRLGMQGVMALSKINAILLAAIAVMMIRLGIQGILGG